MIQLPPDQRLLYDDLMAKVERQGDQASLIATMGVVLKTLLRRQGDAEFLAAIQDAFTSGLAGRDWEESRELAREVVRLVIEKRPEIAKAWQAIHGMPPEAVEYHRRITDLMPPAPPAPEPPPPPPPPPPYEFKPAELLVADYVAGVVARRLSIFTVAPLDFPSLAYCHEQPFFLFTPRFRELAHTYVTGRLLELCRIGLERRVYRHARPEVVADHARLDAFLTEKRPEIWKIITEKLTKLAADHKNAEAKLAAAEAKGEDKGPEFKIVEVPISRPRTYRILGVSFALGTETAMRKTKVRVKPATELDKAEIEALEELALFRDMAAEAGLDIPSNCDFQFLRTLFEFDGKRFAQAVKEFLALAGHKETTRQYLFERLKFVDETYSNHLSDILTIMLFYSFWDGGFGFQELYDVCIGTANNKSALASKRPFLPAEVGRRPRDLAFQVREALRRRAPEDLLTGTVQMLFDVWKVMAKNRFRVELDAALTVLAAFPVAFAGEPDEPVFTAIGHVIHEELRHKDPNPVACIVRVNELYHKVRKAG